MEFVSSMVIRGEIPAKQSRRQLNRLSSEDLAARAQQGCSESFDVLTGRHRGVVLSCFRRKIANMSDAEDLTQETFARVHRYLARFDASRSFRAWLFTIADRLAISHFRKNSAGQMINIDDLEIAEYSVDRKDREAASDLWGRAEAVLGRDLFKVLWWRYGEGMTVSEVAGVLGKSSTSVAVSLYRARVKLRKDKMFRDIGML